MSNSLNSFLGRFLPEQRIYMRSDKTTRYVRVSPFTQTVICATLALSFCWLIVASTALALNSISAKSKKEQAEVLQSAYETRLTQLASERDQRAKEAKTSLDRFYIALDQVSEQQSDLLELEEERRELGKGLNIMQSKLQEAVKARDEAIARADGILDELNSVSNGSDTSRNVSSETDATVAFLTDAFDSTVAERDALLVESEEMRERVDSLEFDAKLLQERGNEIFERLEDAIEISLSPLKSALNRSGINTDALMREVSQGYSGTGGPLTPLQTTEDGSLEDALSLRASALLKNLDDVNLMKLAVQKVPLGHPVVGSFRYTSGFGYRRDPVSGGRRMHSGTDMAGQRGTKIAATGDGIVTFAGTQSGYGRLVKIRHSQGFETVYAHLNSISVKSGQKVSRGDKIGGMGNTGRSTGVHLHYEIRLGGKPLNPRNYMKAAHDVF